MNSILAVTAAGGLSGAALVSRFPSPSTSIQGVWQAVEITTTGPGAQTIRPSQPNLSIITAKHYSHIEIHSNAPRPVVADVANATADELRLAWGPFAAEAGSYELADGSFVTHPVVSKNPAAMARGSLTAYAFRVAGDTLWLTPQRDARGAVPNPPTIKLARVE